MNQYSFQLLRYVPNIVSGEFVNIGLLLFDRDERLIEARFAPDLRRLRCNPCVDQHYLECLRREFEEKLLLGEAFAPYVEGLRGDLSNTLQLSDRRVFEGSEAATGTYSRPLRAIRKLVTMQSSSSLSTFGSNSGVSPK